MFEVYIFENLNLLQSFKTHVLAIVLPIRSTVFPLSRCRRHRGLLKFPNVTANTTLPYVTLES